MNGILGSASGRGLFGTTRRGRSLGAPPSPQWADERVKRIQDALNTPLQAGHCALLNTDGLIGPKTCGAQSWALAQGRRSMAYASNAEDFDAACAKLKPVAPVCAAAAPAPVATPAQSTAAPVDWAALAVYAAAVKAQNDKRAADLVAYAQAVQAAKDREALLAYAAAVKAANDKKAADLLAYVAAVKAAQAAKKPTPRPPSLRAAPVRKPKISPSTPPPPLPEPPPAPPVAEIEPAHASAEVEPVAQAGMSMTTKIGIGVGALALVGYVVFFKPKKARAA